MNFSKNKKRFGVAVIFLSVIFFLQVAPMASAEGLIPCGRTIGTAEEQQPCTLCHLVVGFQRVINFGLKIVTFVALAAITFAGIMYIISAGNQQMMDTAKSFLKSTLIGFAIVIGAWVIINTAMRILSSKDSNGDGVPDFGVTATGRWSDFKCSKTR